MKFSASLGYRSRTSRRPLQPIQVTTLSRTRVLVVMGSYFVLTSAFQAFVPLRASSLGVDGAVLGLLLVLAGGGIGLITDFGFATYADAQGRDKTIFRGFICALMATSIVVLNGSIPVLFLGCFFVGLSISAVGSSLLALLTTTRHHHTQARTQGFNISVQRFGALVAALMVGLALESRHDEDPLYNGRRSMPDTAVCDVQPNGSAVELLEVRDPQSRGSQSQSPAEGRLSAGVHVVPSTRKLCLRL